MDPSDYYAQMGRPSPRREVQLQGPRPTPLKVRKDSYKIKKPPAAPGAGPSQSHHHYPPPHPEQQHPQPPRAPVIIYTVSPKVIHTNPGDFMSLVQRLTGASPRTLSSSSAASFDARPSAADNQPGTASPGTAAGELSPAARFAVMERGAHASSNAGHDDIVDQLGIGSAAALDRSGSFPGILSPIPSSLPPISPSFFSPPPSTADPASVAFLNEMSPVFRSNTTTNSSSSFMEGAFLPSPGNFLSTPTLPSPGAFWDFFNQL